MNSSVNSYSSNLHLQANKSLLNKLADAEESKPSTSYKALSSETTESSTSSTDGSSLTLEELVERMQQTPLKPISNASEVNSDTSSIDTDGDGMLSADEYDTLMSQLDIQDAASAEDFFQQYDTDADGEITLAEMEANQPMKPMRPMGPPPEEAQTSSYLDTDGDGIVSTEEYQAAVSALGIEDTDAADALFAKYDTDSDGNITTEEILAQQSTIVSYANNTSSLSTSEEFKRVASRMLASYEANLQYIYEPSDSTTSSIA